MNKETISTYCVNSHGDKDLAEAIAKQFERAGFVRSENCDFATPYVGISQRSRNGLVIIDSHWDGKGGYHFGNSKETTLEHLTSMVDQLVVLCKHEELIRKHLGINTEGWIVRNVQKVIDELVGDEYAIVREFIEWHHDGCISEHKDRMLAHFKQHRTKHPVTIDELKAEYAKSKGIEVDKIVVKD